MTPKKYPKEIAIACVNAIWNAKDLTIVHQDTLFTAYLGIFINSGVSLYLS